MAAPVIDIAAFRKAFPQFKDEALYPDETIQFNFETAVMYLGSYDWGVFTPAELDRMYLLLTAHLLATTPGLGGGSSGGGGGSAAGPLTGATIDKVSVTFAAPTTAGGWQAWLATSPYGNQLWAFLRLRSAGGLFVGGRPERAAFRKVGGLF